MYKQLKDLSKNQIRTDYILYVDEIDSDTNHFIPTDLANTDYSNFKKEIEKDNAELQDADGNTMTAEEVAEFVATLP